ncbi:hypothetical protein ONE63_010199 [Megalurothrips usitatus]|uniref:Uncharacterized protein n=1 Tax=Megalurothrips usitatus TaxID=439358 RepID=A0AAV7XLT3_9NEOP|nr:hypothetical protein ONE63_010199 [Megalurothrips usitatus]
MMSSFEEELTSIVKMVLNHMDSGGVTRVVEYLMSEKVGATSTEDLKFITPDMLPASIVPPIKAVQLIRYFSIDNQPGSSSSGGHGSHQQHQHAPVARATPATETDDSFKFNVPWNSLPKDTLNSLDNSEQTDRRAQQGDIDRLKLAIVKFLVSSYNSYKELQVGSKKHPGQKVYQSITDQVFEKYPNSLADVINGKRVGDGKAGFKRALLVCTENQMRQKNGQKSAPKAAGGTGTVGVLPEQYLPHINRPEREQQEQLKEELLKFYEEADPDALSWATIKNKMTASYELQRDDIATAKVAIEEAEQAAAEAAKNTNKENVNPSSDLDDPSPKALSELKKSWPYLFYPSGLAWHHNRLTGRDLQIHLNEFMDHHLDNFLHFLTSCSRSSKANLMLGLKLDKKVGNWTAPNKLLKMVFMLAKHFGEDIDILIHSTEKTTLASEIDTEGLANICIVAHDNNPFVADNYLVCADEVILVKAWSVPEAITALVQLAFVLDINYPAMPLTFEFIERFIYGMGLQDTRVKNKKGKVILVLTPLVRNTINDFQQFEKEIEEEV